MSVSRDPLSPSRLDDRKLDSWKEIADYLDREVRTVQRWEKTENLPVHRHEHQKKSTVYAYTSELDDWRKKRQPKDDPEADADFVEEDRKSTRLNSSHVEISYAVFCLKKKKKKRNYKDTAPSHLLL